MMTKTVRHGLHTIGDRGSDIARRFGRGTTDLVDRIGPRRAIIGLAVIVAAIGGSIVLVRYLRARAASDTLDPDAKLSEAAERGAAARNRSAALRANSLAPH